MTQSQVLASTHRKVRELTMWYLSLLKTADPLQQFELNGVKLNSVYWLTAHLTWAEHFLIMETTGSDLPRPEWLNHYQLGCDGTLHTANPDMKELVRLLKGGHETAQQYLLQYPDSSLEATNTKGFSFGSDNTNRMMIQHCIRHEAMHTGHLSMICKLNKIETV